MRERFLVLDGLRGVAALAVFGSHLPMPFAIESGRAVDFFFLLSGFVLAYAYEARLQARGTLGGFVRDRVIRLHPLLLFSMAPAAAALAFAPGMIHSPLPLLTLAAGAIPFPAFWLAGFPELRFPFNPPSWTLFWELLANLLFALIAPRLSTRTLTAFTLVLIAARQGAILWGITLLHTDVSAGLRVLPYFALGILLYRLSGRIALPRWIGMLAAPLLVIPMLVPAFPGSVILVSFFCLAAYPLIVVAGAVREARFPRLCAFLGGMSYPLYILHDPILRGLGMILGPRTGAMAVIQPLLCLAIVWLAWRLYDEPLRAWLRRHFVPPAQRMLPPHGQPGTQHP